MDMEMTGIEITILWWAVVLGLVQIALAASFVTKDRGLSWNLSARDGDPAPIGKIADRLSRASKNYLETFVFFAVAVLLVTIRSYENEYSALGAQLYIWGRVVYLPLYAFGIPVARTIAWTVSLAGIAMILWVGM